MDEPNKDVTILKPKTHKEHYLAKIAGEDVTIPEPKTPSEHYLKKIAENGSGASSLADLSDVEISSESSRPILKYNGSTEKWENVSEVMALLTNPGSASHQGAVYITDTEEIASKQSIFFNGSSQNAYLFGNIIEAALDKGAASMNNLPKETIRNLILAAMNSVYYNVPMFLAIGNVSGIQASLSLDSATSDYATFVGTQFYNSKFYRITLIAYCPAAAEVATVLAKAEELMTYIEPT